MSIISSNNLIENNFGKNGKPHGFGFVQQRAGAVGEPAGGIPPMIGNEVRNNTVELNNILNLNASRPRYAFYLTANTTNPGQVNIRCNNTVTNGPFSNRACVP